MYIYIFMLYLGRDVLVDDVRVRGALRGPGVARSVVSPATTAVPPMESIASVYVGALLRWEPHTHTHDYSRRPGTR